MTSDGPSRQKLDDLLIDLGVERSKLEMLVEKLRGIKRFLEQDTLPPLWVDTGTLRLQSFCTGIERCFVLIVRVINGATPGVADWHRRQLDCMAVAISLSTSWRRS